MSPTAGKYPLTDFVCALIRMTPEQRMAASAERAAARYALPLEWCRWWIAHFRTVFEQQPRKKEKR